LAPHAVCVDAPRVDARDAHTTRDATRVVVDDDDARRRARRRRTTARAR
jgi:hypothetical protein